MAVKVGCSELTGHVFLFAFFLHARLVLEVWRVLSFFFFLSESFFYNIVMECVIVSLTPAKSVLFFKVPSMYSISSLYVETRVRWYRFKTCINRIDVRWSIRFHSFHTWCPGPSSLTVGTVLMLRPLAISKTCVQET